MDPNLLVAVAEGCGQGLIAALLDHTPAADILAAPPSDLPPRALHRLGDRTSLTATAERWLAHAHALDLNVVTPHHSAFAPGLESLPTRPRALFARGNLRLLHDGHPKLAIVGSRTPTPYGLAAAADFAASLSRAGVAIWSGLAYGIDMTAHRTALDQGGQTVAVLAGGLDRIYPSRHTQLAEQIVRHDGLLLSEAPPGLRARRGHFPRRNRILAAAVDAVLVIEAGLTSGSLHTARSAAEVGVPVFALPGPYQSSRSRGCHALVADGASVTLDPEDLLRRLGIERALAGHDAGMETHADDAVILRLLDSGPRPMDLILRESRLERARFLPALLRLQAAGRVRGMPGDLLVSVSR